ncbi:MAG: phage tail protein [Lachnospiraceae bacterium]|nr:phage tail protein [Lachnospiraceae bacterium]MDE7201919.1 phage tail protein [Lachnospiraceae bacterium]
MATVGSFGDIAFYCTSLNGMNKILSFHDLGRSSTASFAEHERNGEKAYLEFGGDGLDEITLTIEADARYGVKPLEVQDKLFRKKASGQAEFFVLGGRKVGENQFVITSISEGFKVLYIDGRPIAMSFQVTMKEYANQVARITTIPSRDQGGKAKMAVETTNEMYTVVKGDCLWNIAKKFYGSGNQYSKIYNANRDKIKNPNLIYPGQVLVIPK